MSEVRELADFSIKYVEKEPTPETFGYSIKSSWFEFGLNETNFNEDGNIHSGNSECTGRPTNPDISCGTQISENEKMDAVLEWNGESEVIEMYKK